MKIGIVILAAGESARMGEPKQLLAYRGRTLLHRVIDTAHAVADSRVAVVLGAHAERIRAELDENRILIVENPDWHVGMGASIRIGLNALLAEGPDISVAIFLTCDQPFLTSAILEDLVKTHERSGFPIVAAEYDDTLGVPALFARPLFPELLALDGESGARRIIRNHIDVAIGVPFADAAIDIDTPADYQRLHELPTLTNA